MYNDGTEMQLRLDPSDIPEELYDLLLEAFREQLDAAGVDRTQYMVYDWKITATASVDI